VLRLTRGRAVQEVRRTRRRTPRCVNFHLPVRTHAHDLEVYCDARPGPRYRASSLVSGQERIEYMLVKKDDADT
jgi:hypothetical protein